MATAKSQTGSQLTCHDADDCVVNFNTLVNNKVNSR